MLSEEEEEEEGEEAVQSPRHQHSTHNKTTSKTIMSINVKSEPGLDLNPEEARALAAHLSVAKPRQTVKQSAIRTYFLQHTLERDQNVNDRLTAFVEKTEKGRPQGTVIPMEVPIVASLGLVFLNRWYYRKSLAANTYLPRSLFALMGGAAVVGGLFALAWNPPSLRSHLSAFRDTEQRKVDL